MIKTELCNKIIEIAKNSIYIKKSGTKPGANEPKGQAAGKAAVLRMNIKV